MDNNNLNVLSERYPVFTCASDAIREAMGVTLDDMRSKTTTRYVTTARIIFSALCRPYVSPAYTIASFLNKTSCAIVYYSSQNQALQKNDAFYKGVFSKVEKIFNEKNKEL